MAARVGPTADLTEGVERIWEPLWDLQQIETFADLAHAANAVDKSPITKEIASYEKIISPVAAAVRAAFLLRVGAIEHLQDSLRDLSNRFSWLPDGSILWAEMLLRRAEKCRSSQTFEVKNTADVSDNSRERVKALLSMADTPDNKEARTYFSKMAALGTPMLTAVLFMAARQAEFWEELISAGGIKDDEEKSKLIQACEVVNKAAKYALPEGIFTAFVSQTKLNPVDVGLAPVDEVRMLAPFLGKSFNPELEREVLEDVASYGRQIGHISDVLDVFIKFLPKDVPLTHKDRAALEQFKRELCEIYTCKKRHAKQ
jgi:hypothetical protein